MTGGGPVEPTMPLPPEPGRRGAPPEERTEASGLPGAYDPTLVVPPAGPPDEPTGPFGEGPGGDDRRKWIYGALAAVGVVILGVVIALALAGGDDNETTTTTSSTSSTSTSTSTSTTSSPTTTTTTPNAPVITAYSASPNPATCPNGSTTIQITLSWATQNALGVSVSIDGPGKYADYGANGSAQVPFACSGSHSYTLTANGSGGQTTQRTITVQPQIAPPTTTTTGAPPTTTTT